MEKVYNLIRLPIFEQGYRYFSDAPPDIGVFLANAISPTAKTDGRVHFRAFSITELDEFLLLEMKKFSFQSDQYGRPGLEYYHVIALHKMILSKLDPGHVSTGEHWGELFNLKYKNHPADEIESLLEFSRKESTTDISEVFRAYFITVSDIVRFFEDSPMPRLDSREKAGFLPSRLSELGTPAQSRSKLPIETKARIRTRCDRIERILLLLFGVLLVSVILLVIESGFIFYLAIKSDASNSHENKHLSDRVDTLSAHIQKVSSALISISAKEPTSSCDQAVVTEQLKSIKASLLASDQKLNEVQQTIRQLGNNQAKLPEKLGPQHTRLNDDLKKEFFNTNIIVGSTVQPLPSKGSAAKSVAAPVRPATTNLQTQPVSR